MQTARDARLVAGAAALALALAAPALADATKPVQHGDTVTVTATVEAIDQNNRQLTLKGEKGNLTTVTVPASVKRFDAIKVGDVVTARYVESVVVNMVQPGDPATAARSTSQGVTPRPGEKPGATFAKQVSSRVKVLAIDKAAEALTVQTPSGSSVSFKVKDKKRLDTVKVGDEFDVTYTEALLLTVDAKK